MTWVFPHCLWCTSGRGFFGGFGQISQSMGIATFDVYIKARIGWTVAGDSSELFPHPIGYGVAGVSALIGSLSHVLLDSIMHADVLPYSPFSSSNPFYHLLSFSALHQLCLYSGLWGVVLFVAAW